METANEIDYRAELLEFAAQVHRLSLRIIGAEAADNHTRALHTAGELCTEAANIKARLQMRDEATGEDRYSLATLAVNTTTPTDSESPFEDE